MAKVFYDHLISIEELLIELDKYQLSHDEKVDLISSADTTIHYRVLDIILTHLPKDKHQEFLKGFQAAPHDKKHLQFLKAHKESIESELLKAIKAVKKQILSELHTLNS